MQHYWLVIKRGLIRRCPRCGQGQIFSGYINLLPECLECGESFRNIRSDDAAPWATVLFVGHLAAWLIGYMVKTDVPSINLILMVLFFVLIVAGLTLPVMKGVFVNLNWISGIRYADPNELND
ncbi:MAG TPA: hypothetical protein DEV64_10210 [Rhodospirillaceae bacterium]|nr:hypothetical protein [Magnetovibrio sp.]HCH57449.1 hypothetical protein [Rhodospirillaceae bacterium]|tara:strand:- start:4198 stop:4566 length:369 start_codon:yes stop_codon:yes gene_type:complete